MMDVSIIGAGRLGTSLGRALARKGYKIRALSCQSLISARESQKIIREGKALTDNVKAAGEGNLIFLCLPDEKLAKAARKLAHSNISWSKKFVFHSSGLLPAEILKPLQERGAFTASVHPIQSFSQKSSSPKHFDGIFWGLEGDKKALSLARKIVRQLKGHPLPIKAKDKPLYHAACSLASNFFVVLLDIASSLLEDIGLKEEDAERCLLPLLEGTLQNVKKFGRKTSLSGPIVRGDKESVKSHLEALQRFPLYSQIYMKLAERALQMARRKKLSTQKIKALRLLLEGK